MEKKVHRKYSAEFKISMLKTHLVGKVSVAEICEGNRIKPSLFYKWQSE